MTAPPPTPAPPPASDPAPPHRRPGFLLLVAAGGAVGTACRAWLEARHGAPAGSWPWATWAINVSGSFVLGLLLTLLSRSGPDTGARRLARLGLGTGFLGGYTTYSTFAVEALLLGTNGRPVAALGYAAGSVAAGVAAALIGALLAGSVPVGGPRRAGASPAAPGVEPRP